MSCPEALGAKNAGRSAAQSSAGRLWRKEAEVLVFMAGWLCIWGDAPHNGTRGPNLQTAGCDKFGTEGIFSASSGVRKGASHSDLVVAASCLHLVPVQVCSRSPRRLHAISASLRFRFQVSAISPVSLRPQFARRASLSRIGGVMPRIFFASRTMRLRDGQSIRLSRPAAAR